MPHASHHSKAKRSLWSSNWSAMERIGRYMRQSLANNLTCEVTTLGRSFICMRNNNGPKRWSGALLIGLFMGKISSHQQQQSAPEFSRRPPSSPEKDPVCRGAAVSLTSDHGVPYLGVPCRKPSKSPKLRHQSEFCGPWLAVDLGAWEVIEFRGKILHKSHDLAGLKFHIAPSVL